MRTFALILTFYLVAGASSPAAAGCAEWLGLTAARRSLAAYLAEFKTPEGRFKWSRFVLAPAKVREAATEPRWGGFLTPDPVLKKWQWYHAVTFPLVLTEGILQAVPRTLSRAVYGQRYAFTPINGAVSVLGWPFRFATRRILGTSHRISKLVSWPAGFLAATFLMSMGDEAVGEIEQTVVVAGVEEHGPEWDVVIETDYRYQHIFEARESQKLSPGAARLEAFLWQKQLKKYYVEADQVEKMSAETLLTQPHYGRLQGWVKDGVPREGGYAYDEDFSAKLSDEQVKQLIQLNHLRFVELELLNQRVNQPEALAKAKQNERLAELIDDIESDPYAKFLLTSFEKKKITKGDLLFRLQEDSHHKVLLAENQVLKRGLVGKDDRAISIEDFRHSAIEEMKAKRAKSPDQLKN